MRHHTAENTVPDTRTTVSTVAKRLFSPCGAVESNIVGVSVCMSSIIVMQTCNIWEIQWHIIYIMRMILF